MVTDRDLGVLQNVARYYVLNRPQIQGLCFPEDHTGRVTRRRLQALVVAGLINRHRAQVIYPHTSAASSVYYPAPKGCQLLSEIHADDRYLLTPTQCPQSHHVMHWLAVCQTHLQLDAAIERQSDVNLLEWINEWDIVNKDESAPEKRFRLYTHIQDTPRLVCAPDAGLVIGYREFKKVYYLEQDRATSGANQVASRKIKGYAAMQEQGLHRQQFSQANVEGLSVLCIAPTATRRDALRRAFAKHSGHGLWKFASAQDLTPEFFLHEPVFYPTVGDPLPLVRKT